MRGKYSYIWPTVIAAALALGIFVGGKLHFDDTPEKLFSTNSKKDKLKVKNTSLAGAGKIIGMLERLFVFAFILLNAWSAIGFLITAKSVFRFGDLTEGKNRQLTEYVLIGTLLSFGLAIGAGLLFNYILRFL